MTGVTDERTSQSELEQVKERVQDVAGEAKEPDAEQLRAQIEQRSTQAGEQVSSTAQAMRRDERAAADRGQRTARRRSSTRSLIGASGSAAT